ncbi:MAG: L-2-hydroxyglutarate oxidase [Flavobacteriales bacterium]|jgi:L-2-hydroxyglutarate oxidase|nr:L-2-hydroxyglutarate oxidase [Flavobacteriales bacterium]MBP6641539.1 L-2-hydroxyglutarate oxidase [Flavobacteriales bacterium]MBP7154620.1 L-2-hydroxyglutarate oxidase [Flavobacteriales bacterium]HQW40735.1 L-2-hydroxyglutarate oxidase [Flavobacteriales bacterium]
MENLKNWDVVIVGGGIVGAATMYKLQTRFPKLRLLLLEKEKALADHQTGHNSGVIHSGIYYKPGSSKARNCVKGRRELVAFAKDHRIKHDICGKLIVATKAEELPRLEKIFSTGMANGIEDMERVSAAQIKEIEPFCVGIEGVRVGCTGIIDFRGATEKMAEIALGINSHSSVNLNEEFLGVEQQGEVSIVRTSKATYNTRYAIFCGGLQSDRLAKKDGAEVKERIVGFRGDYYDLTPAGKHKVKHLIYPVPDPRFPFLGVHFTRMTDGSIECGPNAVFTFKREGYGKTDFDMKDTLDALSYGGTWKLFMKNMSYGINEYRRAFSKRLFLKTLCTLIPSLTMEDIEPGRAGVRAMLLGRDGAMVDDFRIERRGDHIHVLNAPSPAATACLAIGEQIVDMAVEQLKIGQ